MFDVSAMNVLDGDDVRLSAHGRLAERDIVQVSGAPDDPVWLKFHWI